MEVKNSCGIVNPATLGSVTGVWESREMTLSMNQACFTLHTVLLALLGVCVSQACCGAVVFRLLLTLTTALPPEEAQENHFTESAQMVPQNSTLTERCTLTSFVFYFFSVLKPFYLEIIIDS